MSTGDIVIPFFRLGVEHILLGLDHLLFLAGLLVVARDWRSIIAVVTTFTLAHSLTLALAALDVLRIPNRWSELLIAASILWVGAENIWQKGEPKSRWAVTALFGLVHGLGFATALREVGLGQQGRGIALPLVSFNVGIEVGQIAVACAMVALFGKLSERAGDPRRLRMVVSAIVALCGACWVFIRIKQGFAG